jgi:hypothetical protein
VVFQEANRIMQTISRVLALFPSISNLLYSNAPVVFGQALQPNDTTIPQIIIKCKQYLEKYGLKTSGLFRVNANLVLIRQLKEEINKGNDPLPPLEQNTMDVHTVAGLFKAYFRELREPLCTFELYNCFLASAAISQHEVRCRRIRDLLHYLPASNYIHFRFLIEFLAVVSEHHTENLMNATNLALVFAPALFWQKDSNDTLSDSPYACKVVELLILHHQYFFGDANNLPPNEATIASFDKGGADSNTNPPNNTNRNEPQKENTN